MTMAINLDAALAEKTTFLEGRTRHTDTTGYFARLADYRDGGVFAAGFSGTSQWERHPNGDEIVQILKGNVRLTLRTAEGDEKLDLEAGMIVIVPQGCWHQFHAPDGVTLMTTTPQPTEHITDAEPPLDD
ncbi:MAG: cupin domain-containing protein [Rhodospirillaceae bacterium]|jgi:mannose-6-phosphate isomerase-like protein (cupin superfamily)|nr:cupin domain-containing protein [Rhodospirillaceae bacterium]MBT3494103.1 cupin domain-containing protein [Rhodospirillaceae bacterium]MBT3778750.1 cupin domain-containing protein [Rhodospirillaceae bacterium]MBT3977030.1 cupin domain-containing protein [Rhodospirillaceae bacterium]MBT4170669.1 cupin domain-containing protein [Rhodospirillaceae bacterium]